MSKKNKNKNADVPNIKYFNTVANSPIRNDKKITVFGKPNVITIDKKKFTSHGDAA